MGAETIVLPNGQTAELVATHTLTPVKDIEVKVVPVSRPQPIIFYIGGAGDQESYYFAGAYRNINDVEALMNDRVIYVNKSPQYKKYILGYQDARGQTDIKKHIIDVIPGKSSPIYIVGHSLGGWNGAHLSKILSDEGYKVSLLITLDPVGKGMLVWLGSDIYYSEPTPIADMWINIRANPKLPGPSDKVADFGERWIITSGPTINATVNIEHAYAGHMIATPVQGTKSALDFLFEMYMKDISA